MAHKTAYTVNGGVHLVIFGRLEGAACLYVSSRKAPNSSSTLENFGKFQT